MEQELPSLNIYISFHEDDRRLVKTCVKVLERTIKGGLTGRYNAKFFKTNDVAVGERIGETLDERVESADLVIVLFSYNYRNNKIESQRVYARHEHPIIVMLEDVNKSVAVDPFVASDVVGGDSFSKVKGKEKTEQEFANRVFSVIERELNRMNDLKPKLSSEVLANKLISCRKFNNKIKTIVAHAEQLQTEANSNDVGHKEAFVKKIDNVVESLITWACKADGDGLTFCALLGNLGIGKTTTSILLTRKLLELRKSDRQLPLPIYFDLRNLSPKTLTDFGLRTVLARLLSASTASPVEVDDLLDTICSENTLVIFDGLDEVLVHLLPNDGQRLTRSLLEILTLTNTDKRKSAPQTRLLLSCRTQYFRNIKEEFAFFDGQGRERVRGEDYIVFTLLPFDEDQIREYLALNIPGSDSDQLFEMIRSVHDLRALAAQPVMLDMIREVLLSVENDLSRGARIRSVDLYERFVGQWLTRDDGKHSLIPEHKILLMAHLAWQVWRSGSRTWSARWMEKWMLQFLHLHQEMELDYERRMPDQWKQDFRTATFLSRRGDDFSFTHSSLLEFFLAKRLCDCLFEEEEDQALEVWNITKPSDETFGFLAELIDRLSDIERGQALSCLEKVGKQGTVAARTNVFTYTLMALERGLPYPRPGALDLSGTDLRKWTIGSKRASLDLRGVSFRSARLDDTRFNHVCLDCVNASRASMQRALFEYCALSNVDFNGTDLSGAIFRHCDLSRTSLGKAKRHRTQLLHASGYEQGLSGVLVAPLLERSEFKILPKTQILSGHVDGVTAVAWSPDGSRIATGSAVGVRVWDAVTGEDLFSLELECGRGVESVAWSPDSRRIATGSIFGDVRVWDAVTGENVLSLEHDHRVGSVAWSPDGRRIATGSAVGVQVLDAVTGEELLSLEHGHWVGSVAWSPDSRRIATGSDVGVQVWDAVTGENVLSLEHGHWVGSVAWSPDGSRIVTGSFGAVRVLDAVTGENVLSLEHDHGVGSVVWSPDGSRIVTGSDVGVQVWDAVTGEELLSLEHDHGVGSVVWSPDSKRIVTGSIFDDLRVLDAVTGENVLSLEHGHRVRSVAWSPDGSRIVTDSTFDDLRVWDAVTGENVLSLEQDHWVESVVWSPDGSRIATGSAVGVQVLDAVTGEDLFSLGYGHWVDSVAWSPDGSRIAAGSDGGVRVWDAATGKELLSLKHDHRLWSVAWSPDGSRIVTDSTFGGVRVWDAVTGENVLSLECSHEVESVAWSPDGKRILTKTRRNEIRIWDVTSGEQASFFITALPEGEYVALSADQTKVIHASAGAWRWLGRLAVLPDGKLERIPVEIDGPLPPLGPDAEVE